MIAVFVPGDPATQGSIAFKGMSRRGRPILTSTNKSLNAWRDKVRSYLIDTDDMPRERFTGPVHLEVEFVLERNDSMSKKAALDADSAQGSDIDKLLRAVMDAISDGKRGRRELHGVLRNDRQVCSVTMCKRFAAVGETPGCHLEIMDAKQAEERSLTAA